MPNNLYSAPSEHILCVWMNGFYFDCNKLKDECSVSIFGVFLKIDALAKKTAIKSMFVLSLLLLQ